MRADAGDVLDRDKGRIGLEADAVVGVVYDGVFNGDERAPIGVPAIAILGWVGGRGSDVDGNAREVDIGAVGDQVEPKGTVDEMQIFERGVVQAVDAYEHRPLGIDVLRIQVVPDLTLSIERTSAKDFNARATELEEGGGILEAQRKGIGLPVVGVVCEEDCTSNVDLDVLEKGQVHRFAHGVGDAWREDDFAADAIVAVMEG